VHEKVHEKPAQAAGEAGEAAVKPTKVRALDLFNLYSELLGRAGFETQFQCANSLARRLKRDFPLLDKHMTRDTSGSYFAAQNMAGLYEQAAELDAKYRFDVSLLDIESVNLRDLKPNEECDSDEL
jgi:hypothetical protein